MSNQSTEWHNPENVPADKVPEGWRFLKPFELDGRFARKCKVWNVELGCFSTHWAMFADQQPNVYIVPIEPATELQEAKQDPINPAHYTHGGIECIDAIKAAMTPEEFRGFLKGQVFKYNWRLGRKGAAAEDSRKAAWYQDRLTKELEAAR